MTGLLLDSSELIHHERFGRPVDEVLLELRASAGPVDVVLSAVSVVELEHGLYRARTDEQRELRAAYLDSVRASIPVEPFTREIGSFVARIDAEARSNGSRIPFGDLLIGGTALFFGYWVVTRNERDFRRIPNLQIWPGK